MEGTPITRNSVRHQATWLVAAGVLSMALGLARCTNRDYDRAVASGRTVIAAASEMERLYPGTTHFISYYTGEAGEPSWNSEAGIHGRYVLTMQCRVEFDRSRRRVTSHQPEEFTLLELAEVRTGSGGSAEVSYGATQIRFGTLEWRSVVESGGDLSVLGVEIRKDAPIPGFVSILTRSR